jgi:hypothetical protein
VGDGMPIREFEFHNEFVNYLKSKGYPENAIIVNPVYEYLGRKYRPDIVIVDPDSNKPLAIFELKNIKSDRTIATTIQQLATYAQAIKNPDILLFAAFPIGEDNKSIDFEIFPLDDIGEKGENEISVLKKKGKSKNKVEGEEKEISTRLIKTDNPPEYKILKNSRLTEEISKISDEQEQTIGYFQILCLVSAIFVFLILMADILNLFKIDTQRLALIGVIIGLFILPYASKLKILGFEFERLTQSKKGKEEK